MADRPPSNVDPGLGTRHLPALTPAGRELLEVLWGAGRPLTTRQLHDAIGRRFPHRAGRKIQTVSTLLAELMAQGRVAGEKRGGTRWEYRAAVSRGEGLSQLARRVVGELVREPEDRRHLVLAALRMAGFVPVNDPEGLAAPLDRQAKDAAAQPLSDVLID